MSYEMHIVRCRFETLDPAGAVVSTTYGVRIYDDMGCTYFNHLDSLDELVSLDADGLVDLAKESEIGAEMLDGGLGYPRLYVDNELYEGEDDDDAKQSSGT